MIRKRATFEEATEDARRKYAGDSPNILALPGAYVSAVPHLCMKDPAENSYYRDDHPAHPCGC